MPREIPVPASSSGGASIGCGGVVRFSSIDSTSMSGGSSTGVVLVVGCSLGGGVGVGVGAGVVFGVVAGALRSALPIEFNSTAMCSLIESSATFED